MTNTSPDAAAHPLGPIKDLFVRSWRLYRAQFLVFVGILAGPFAVIAAGRIVIAAGFFQAGFATVCVGYLFSLIAMAAVIFSVARGTGIAASYRGIRSLFFPLLWVGVLSYLAVLGGFIMLVLPGILVGIWLLFTMFIVVVEGKRGLAAMQQSREYVRGYWWTLFGRYLLVVFIAGVLGAVVSGFALLIFGKMLGPLVPLVFEMVVLPFLLVYIYQLYQDLAAIKPGSSAGQATSGRGFFITSIIVGLAGLILIPIALVIGMLFLIRSSGGSESSFLRIFQSSSSSVPAPQLISELSADLSDPAIWREAPTALGSPSDALGNFSMIIPPHYEIDPLMAGEVIVKSSESLLPYIIITPGVGSFSDILTRVRSLAQQQSAGNPVAEATTSFAGYPAYSETSGGQLGYRIILLRAGNAILLMDIRYSNAADPTVRNLEDQMIDKISGSLTERVSSGTPSL